MDSAKRKSGPELVSNPFIKKRNLEWRISPPPLRDANRRESKAAQEGDETKQHQAVDERVPSANNSDSAAVEAGEVKIADHAAYFSQLLLQHTLSPYPENTPRLAVSSYRALYERNFGSPHGAHFVIHQHDHPVAGTHYDIRLQINSTSSASWACMYGLPGDPNSARLLRNATETRVHCLWNHLIETASAATGSLLIWDTGTYAVLERRSKHAPAVDPASQETEDQGHPDGSVIEQEKLARAFADRKIRLRLDGARLPRPYVLNLRLTKDEDAAGRSKAEMSAQVAPRRRRRRKPVSGASKATVETSSSSGDSSDEGEGADAERDEEYNDGTSTMGNGNAQDETGLSAMERELRELEDAEVRRTNAYPGASNTIGSVHQRKWFLSMDREACGFVKTRKGGRVVWERTGEGDAVDSAADDGHVQGSGRLAYPFYVCGPEFERSVVTGRLGEDILKDEGVVGFVNRKGWRAVMN